MRSRRGPGNDVGRSRNRRAGADTGGGNGCSSWLRFGLRSGLRFRIGFFGLGLGLELRRGRDPRRCRCGSCGLRCSAGAAAARLGGCLGCGEDRLGHFGERLRAETGCGEELLGALLGAREDRAGLCAGPLERLLDLGAGGVRQLGCLVARLLQQAGAARLGLAELGRRVAVRVREQLAGLGLGGVHDLVALALALLAEALDLPLLLLQLALAAGDLDLGAPELGGRRVLRVALERVGELGGGADQVQRVHADGVTRGIDAGRLAGRLEHAQLRLQLQRVAAEAVECLANALGLVGAVVGLRQVLEPRERGQGRLGRRCCHEGSVKFARAAATGPAKPESEVCLFLRTNSARA